MSDQAGCMQREEGTAGCGRLTRDGEEGEVEEKGGNIPRKTTTGVDVPRRRKSERHEGGDRRRRQRRTKGGRRVVAG